MNESIIKTFLCDNCGTRHPVQQRTIFKEQYLCDDCLNETTLVCSRCGERIWAEDNSGTEAVPLCDNCFTHHYTMCSRCGQLLHNNDAYYESDDDDDALCYNCYTASDGTRAIHDYSYKPVPVFHGSGPRYFGVELEIDGAGEVSRNARELLNLANHSKQLLFCKHDGSLDDGFELVTHPMSLNFHMHEMPWKSVLDAAVRMSYRSHQAGTCGLHVHISRAAFGQTELEQDVVIARILYFFEAHWNELLQFSRRTRRQLERWANRYGYKEQPKEILDHAKKGYGAGRYTCVNLQNENTIEFRIFRGTLKYNTLIATLQLVDRVCDVALYLSDEEIKSMSWSTFVTGCTQPELVQYLKERRLYVNEPTDGKEEL